MTEHPRQYPRSALQTTRGLTTENVEGPQITMPPGRKGFIKEHSGGQFVHFRIQIFINPRMWDGDKRQGNKAHLAIPTTHPSRLQQGLDAAISENKTAGVDVGERYAGEEAGGNVGMRDRRCQAGGLDNHQNRAGEEKC